MALVKHSSAYHQTDERQMAIGEYKQNVSSPLSYFVRWGATPPHKITLSTPPSESVFFEGLKPEIYALRWEREQLRKQVTLIFFVDGL